jgi:glutamate-1-semialdehyde aminotransferase
MRTGQTKVTLGAQLMSNAIAPKKKTTNELLNEREELYQQIAANGGELTPEMESLMASNSQDLERKTDSIHFAIERLEADGEFFKSQAKMYQEAARARESSAKRIREMIKFAMIEHGIDRIAGDAIEYYLSPTKQALDGDGIPSGYEMIVTETVADKERIRSALESGQEVEGYRLRSSYALRSKPIRK